MATNPGGLVAGKNGPVSRQIFIEPEIRWQKLERMLARCSFVSVCCKDAEIETA